MENKYLNLGWALLKKHAAVIRDEALFRTVSQLSKTNVDVCLKSRFISLKFASYLQ